MSLIKSKEEINKLRQGGAILKNILEAVAVRVRPGVSTHELNVLAEELIKKSGANSAFKNYGPKENPFPAALCTSINSVVVHGIPSKTTILRSGDIIGLDLGIEYKGMFTDGAITVGVGQIEDEDRLLIEVTKKALDLGIAQARAGKRIGDIGAVIQKNVEAAGLNVVRDLVGHGVGHAVHEDPQVPGYGKPNTGKELVPGMVLAIEPMVTAGSYALEYEEDGWTIVTRDRSRAAHFEHTIVVTTEDPEILT